MLFHRSRITLLLITLSVAAAARSPDITGSVSTCANGDVRGVHGQEVHLFSGHAAAQLRQYIVAAEQVIDSSEAYRAAFARIRTAVKERARVTSRTDREGKFRFDAPGELVLALHPRKPIFSFALVKNGDEATLWMADSAQEGCRKRQAGKA